MASRLNRCASHRDLRGAYHINKQARQAAQEECIAVAVFVSVFQAVQIVELELKAMQRKTTPVIFPPSNQRQPTAETRAMCVEKCSPGSETITPTIPHDVSFIRNIVKTAAALARRRRAGPASDIWALQFLCPEVVAV